MKSTISDFRHLMAMHNISAAIIPQTDPHQSEYIADHWQLLHYLSGFTGSAGTLVITAEKAFLWTDSRYFIQAAAQLEGSGIDLMKDGLPSTPSIMEYLIENLPEGATVGIDGFMFSLARVDEMRAQLGAHGIGLDISFDVADRIWPDRPQLPMGKIFVHDEIYAGQSARSKIDIIRRDMHLQGADAAIVAPLDEIAWTLNIRCNDVEYNPVAISYLFVTDFDATLLIDRHKVDAGIIDYLGSQGIDVYPVEELKPVLSSHPKVSRVLFDTARTSAAVAAYLGDKALPGTFSIAEAKACKNDVQIRGFRCAMVRDGVALVRAFMEMETILAKGETLTELDVCALLLKHRSRQPLFFEESFATIAAYGPNGAIVHYEPDQQSNAVIHPDGLLLIDSGAQYLDGTTDITRTIAMGTPTEEEKHDFTLVMKGHIALATMVFPAGTYGVQLDVEARKFLWREGLSYLHGTGHGVGHFLNVHEGPQQIRTNYIPAVLRRGMVTSNEPGLYRENIHGIRCENLILCVDAMTTDFGQFLKFETLTLFPFDRSLFQTSIMSAEEIAWVNDYHTHVFAMLSPHLTDDECRWLESKTRPI